MQQRDCVDGGEIKPLGEPTEIVVHHSASGPRTTVEDITEWHTDPKPNGNGWPHIGYHYVITMDGEVHATLSLRQFGYHCPPNKGRIGICVVGNNERVGHEWNLFQIRALDKLIRSLCRVFPQLNSTAAGHRAFNPKRPCPGLNARWLIDLYREIEWDPKGPPR